MFISKNTDKNGPHITEKARELSSLIDTPASASALAVSSGPAPEKSPLLHAWHDPLANLKTISPCVRLGDLNGDGDFKLIVCDLDKKMRVYRGTSLNSECSLLESPVAVCVIYTETSFPRIPSIAVAAGSHIFIYRQLRPFRKWTCPPLDLTAAETEVWNSLKHDGITSAAAVKALIDARDRGLQLSSRSLDLISIENDLGRTNFIQEMKDVPFQQQTLITCMEVLKKDSEEPDSLCHLVVGTESRHIYILQCDVSGSNFQCKVKLTSVPVMFSVTGIFDVEWRVSIACRDGKLYTVRQGDIRGTALLSGAVLDLNSQAIALAKQEKTLWVATMDRIISCYSLRGKRTKSIVLNEDVADMTDITVKRAKVSHLLVVAFTSGDVRLYKDGVGVYSFKLDRPVIAVRFGPYGREENSVVFVHGQGALTIKIWRRTADIESMNPPTGPPPEQDVPIPVPKKTKLYIEQTQREKEQAASMHRAFHKDLWRMRLETARAYVKTLTEGYMGTTSVGTADIRIQVQVLGLGPQFVLKVTLHNAGSQPMMQARMVLSFDADLYVMGHVPESRQCFILPPLIPGVKHIVETHILNIDPQGRAGQIMILLHQPSSTSLLPLLSASVKMPVSELSSK